MTLFQLEKYKKDLIFLEKNYRAKGKVHDACWVRKKLEQVEEQIKDIKWKEAEAQAEDQAEDYWNRR